MSTVAPVREPSVFEGKLGIIQGFVPAYREELFNLLHDRCTGGLEVFAGRSPEPATKSCTRLSRATLELTKNRVMLPSPFTVIYQQGIIRWLEKWQPDALICEANPRYLATRSAVRWMRARNRPVLGWGLGTLMLAKGFAPLRTFVRRRFLAAFDGVICYSSRAKREYAALGLDARQLFVAHNSTARPTTDDMPRRSATAQNGPAVLLFVGRINAGKKVGNLITAAARLSRQTSVRLIIVGDGDARLMANLRSQAAKELPNAEFLGPKHGPELAECFAMADLFVLPGLGGLAVQEAMARGLPVVVADGDGTQEDLVFSETGWNVRPDDIEDLTAALEAAVSDRERLRVMASAIYKRVREEMNVDAMADKMILGVNEIKKFVLSRAR